MLRLKHGVALHQFYTMQLNGESIYRLLSNHVAMAILDDIEEFLLRSTLEKIRHCAIEFSRISSTAMTRMRISTEKEIDELCRCIGITWRSYPNIEKVTHKVYLLEVHKPQVDLLIDLDRIQLSACTEKPTDSTDSSIAYLKRCAKSRDY